MLASWCALRFGELTELRRNDIDTKHGLVRVRRGVIRTRTNDSDGTRRMTTVIKTPKSDAGVRDVAIPPHLIPMLRDHLKQHAAPGADGLLFSGADGGHLAPSSLYGRLATTTPTGGTRAGWGYYHARDVAGRDDLRFHDLRHTGAVLAAQGGATLAELMGRLGHSTPSAALRYQHAAAERDHEIARRLSLMVSDPSPSSPGRSLAGDEPELKLTLVLATGPVVLEGSLTARTSSRDEDIRIAHMRRQSQREAGGFDL